jgi:hypothetical protein
VIGRLTGILTVLKGLPLAYNRDLQEDKGAVFDTADILLSSLEVMAPLMKGVVFKTEKLRETAEAGFSFATDLAEHLALRGLPFRRAHAAVGELVKWCIGKKVSPDSLALEDLRRFSPLFDRRSLKLISADASVRSKKLPGGTAPSRVRAALGNGTRSHLTDTFLPLPQQLLRPPGDHTAHPPHGHQLPQVRRHQKAQKPQCYPHRRRGVVDKGHLHRVESDPAVMGGDQFQNALPRIRSGSEPDHVPGQEAGVVEKIGDNRRVRIVEQPVHEKDIALSGPGLSHPQRHLLEVFRQPRNCRDKAAVHLRKLEEHARQIELPLPPGARLNLPGKAFGPR